MNKTLNAKSKWKLEFRAARVLARRAARLPKALRMKRWGEKMAYLRMIHVEIQETIDARERALA